jgi:succinate-acetate transporter protein
MKIKKIDKMLLCCRLLMMLFLLLYLFLLLLLTSTIPSTQSLVSAPGHSSIATSISATTVSMTLRIAEISAEQAPLSKEQTNEREKKHKARE